MLGLRIVLTITHAELDAVDVPKDLRLDYRSVLSNNLLVAGNVLWMPHWLIRVRRNDRRDMADNVRHSTGPL